MFDEIDLPYLYVKPSLNDDVEKWLKNESNKITVLEPGFTKFPDGKIPKERVQVKPLDIEKYNAEKVTKKAPVKVEKPKLEKAKKVKAKPIKKPKPKNGKVEREKTLKVKPVKPLKPTKLIVYSERAMIYMHNCEVANTAREKNLKKVEALCSKHGYTTFTVLTNRMRCVKCIEGYNRQKSPEHSRLQFNRDALRAALESGKTTFIGKCVNHGETEFFICENKLTLANASYKCRKCHKTTQTKYEIKRSKAA
ncbi:hypothetical protein [Acinetobacter calcoaceticus]|uniref:hypothetical protein n=1 Tax=Acinetobacter calcoaceticus TaxID=471 RepID=UPI000FD925AA|nr:hypothetical protein [Acinetobacter calcoaceticus]